MSTPIAPAAFPAAWSRLLPIPAMIMLANPTRGGERPQSWAVIVHVLVSVLWLDQHAAEVKAPRRLVGLARELALTYPECTIRVFVTRDPDAAPFDVALDTPPLGDTELAADIEEDVILTVGAWLGAAHPRMGA